MSSALESKIGNENVSISDMAKIYTKKWHLFLLSILFFGCLAYLYLRYTPNQYEARATIKINEDNKSGGIDVIKELDLFGGAKSNLEDEIQIISSRSNFIQLVNNLNLNIRCYEIGNIKSSELYSNTPIYLNFLAPDTAVAKANVDFYIRTVDENLYSISENSSGPFKEYSFGNQISTSVGDVIITPNFDSNVRPGRDLLVSVRPVEVISEFYRRKTEVTFVEDYSLILNLRIKDEVGSKAVDILDELVRIYNLNSALDRKRIADNTSKFIDDRIREISTNLTNVDATAEDFKASRGLVDLGSQANMNINIGATTQQDLAETQTQFNVASSMRDIIDSQQGFEVLPANIGLSDQSLASLTQQYNQLVLERERLLKSSNDKNPVVVNLNQQLQGLRSSIKSSLNGTVNSLGLKMNQLSSQKAIISSRLYSAPKNERALRDITRRQQTTESLYLYLLQKREEAQVAAASTSPKSQIIDRAYLPSIRPIYPKRKVIYLAAIIVGFLLPFTTIYALDLFDNKIHNMNSLSKIIKNIPILGELPEVKYKSQKLVSVEDRSVLAEALRIIRTNLDYLIRGASSLSSGRNNVVFITSGTSGEGKTFLSANLSRIIVGTGKKVLLIGADIRNPKFHDFFFHGKDFTGDTSSLKKAKGLTDYLYDHDVDLKSIIASISMEPNNLDIIFSGRLVPNPAELLMNSRMGDLFSQVVEEYDYIIVDTAPIMLVADTLLINKYADHLIYVVRANRTEEKTLEYPLGLLNEGKISGLTFVVNGVKVTELGYGGKYGYGYGKRRRNWFSFS